MLEPGTSRACTSAPAATPAAGFTLPAEGVNLEELEQTSSCRRSNARGNQTRAAALLGVHRDQIRYRIEKFGLKKADT